MRERAIASAYKLFTAEKFITLPHRIKNEKFRRHYFRQICCTDLQI